MRLFQAVPILWCACTTNVDPQLSYAVDQVLLDSSEGGETPVIDACNFTKINADTVVLATVSFPPAYHTGCANGVPEEFREHFAVQVDVDHQLAGSSIADGTTLVVPPYSVGQPTKGDSLLVSAAEDDGDYIAVAMVYVSTGSFSDARVDSGDGVAVDLPSSLSSLREEIGQTFSSPEDNCEAARLERTTPKDSLVTKIRRPTECGGAHHTEEDDLPADPEPNVDSP